MEICKRIKEFISSLEKSALVVTHRAKVLLLWPESSLNQYLNPNTTN